MNRRQYVLAGMAAGKEAAIFQPVQIQKLFFLLDREIPKHTGGPHFNFSAYDYGPFDSAVYDEVEALAREGLAMVDKSGFYRVYSLTHEGLAQGKAALGELTPQGREYAVKAADWVRAVTFNQLVSAIYDRFPDMKANSVFRQ